MNFKKSKAQLTTVTRNTSELEEIAGNVYEAAAVISKRANQISTEMKEELTAKINEFASSSDNLEEIFENREQIEISKFYESLPKPNAFAIDEFLTDKIYFRNPENTDE